MLPGLWSGAGVIIALDPIPTIMVSRSVIPVSLCEISVIISSKYVPAKILYLGGFVIITVDRENMPPIQLPKISTREPKIGDKIEVVGLDSDSQLVHKETQISTITQNNNGMFLPPGWQQPCGTEAIFIRDLPQCAGGVLVDPEDKSLIALWAMAEPSNKFFGLNFQQYIQPILKTLEKGEEVRLWSHGWTFILFQLHSSLDMGVKEPHTSNIRLIARNFNAEPYAVVVSSKIGFKRPVSEDNDFKLGDFIIQIDRTPVGRTADLRLLAQRESAKVLIMRNGREMQIESRGVAQPAQSTLRIVSWAGLILQKSITGVEPTPEFMASLGKEGIENPDDMVYIAAVTLGGPSIGSLAPATWILEVDNEKVRKLDDILYIIEKNKGSGQNSDEYTRIKVLSRDGSTPIAGIKLDSKLHPAWILEGKEGKWEFRELE